MPGRKKKKKVFGAIATTAKIAKTRPEDITPDQYEQGFKMWKSRMAIGQILASTGMTKPQFKYLTWNALPGFPEQCPSYVKRFADISAAIQNRAQEAAEKLSEDAPKALAEMSELSNAARGMTRVILASIMSDMKANMALPADQRKPIQMMMMTQTTRQTLNTLKHFADFAKVAEAFRKVYESPYQKIDPVSGMDKNAKIDLSADMALPAMVATMQDVQEQQEQGEEDYHQRLFRDFDNWTDAELDRYLKDNELPEREYGALLTPPKIVELTDQEDEG